MGTAHGRLEKVKSPQSDTTSLTTTLSMKYVPLQKKTKVKVAL